MEMSFLFFGIQDLLTMIWSYNCLKAYDRERSERKSWINRSTAKSTSLFSLHSLDIRTGLNRRKSGCPCPLAAISSSSLYDKPVSSVRGTQIERCYSTCIDKESLPFSPRPTDSPAQTFWYLIHKTIIRLLTTHTIALWSALSCLLHDECIARG